MHPTASHRYPTAGDLYVPCSVICTKSLKQSYSPDLEPILYIFAVVLICNVDRILLREQLRQTKNDMNFYRQPNLTLHGMHRHTAHAPASGALSQAVGGDQVCALRTSISDLNLGMSMLTGFRIASQILSCRRSLVYLSLGGPTLQAVQGAGRPSPGHFDRQGRRRRGRGAPSLKAGEGGGIARERRAPASLSLDRWSVNGVCACTLSSMHARKALFLTASSS
jgi:hypothetical protein